MQGFNEESIRQLGKEISESMTAAMLDVGETLRAASITIEEGMKNMIDTFATYTEWVRENYPAAVDTNGKLRDNFLRIIADADEGNRAERYYVESLNTQPRHECGGLGDNAGYVDLLPPHHGTDGPVKTVHGMFVVYASSSWKLTIDQEEVDVEFCPFCGKQLLASANEPGNNAGDVYNAEEALYDSGQNRPVDLEFIDAATTETVCRWAAFQIPGVGDSVLLPEKTDLLTGKNIEWVIQRRYWNQEGGVYHVTMLITRRRDVDAEVKRQMSRMRKPS